MLTNQRQTKRLREKIVVANESDVHKLEPRMIDHLRVSKLQAPLSSRANEIQDEELSMLKMGRSLCDQEPSSTHETIGSLDLASGQKRLITQ